MVAPTENNHRIGVNITLIRQQNFIIENMGFPYNFVGANTVRPYRIKPLNLHQYNKKQSDFPDCFLFNIPLLPEFL